ncbi:hypothetical protein CF319_g5932 [Tilletia indica]|nr:hypothetical protein CF319_g5932 [Tilletia indica]
MDEKGHSRMPASKCNDAARHDNDIIGIRSRFASLDSCTRAAPDAPESSGQRQALYAQGPNERRQPPPNPPPPTMRQVTLDAMRFPVKMSRRGRGRYRTPSHVDDQRRERKHVSSNHANPKAILRSGEPPFAKARPSTQGPPAGPSSTTADVDPRYGAQRRAPFIARMSTGGRPPVPYVPGKPAVQPGQSTAARRKHSSERGSTDTSTGQPSSDCAKPKAILRSGEARMEQVRSSTQGPSAGTSSIATDVEPRYGAQRRAPFIARMSTGGRPPVPYVPGKPAVQPGGSATARRGKGRGHTSSTTS